MNARSLLAVVAVSAVLGLVGLALARQPEPGKQPGQPKQAAPKPVRWEYCSVVQTANLANATSTWTVMLPGKTVNAASAKAAAKELGTANAEDTPNDLLNVLGYEGWELTTQVEYVRGGVLVRGWTLRRQMQSS